MDFISVSHIVAVDSAWGIGKNNKIPWHISGDLRYFKETTLERCVIMGRKTFDSLGKPLSQRTNIVITRKGLSLIPGIFTFSNLEEALQFGKEKEKKELFIIGGGEIFKDTLHLANRAYITKIDQNFDCDTFYPELDENEWKCVSIKKPQENPDFPSKVSYTFQVWERVNQ